MMGISSFYTEHQTDPAERETLRQRPEEPGVAVRGARRRNAPGGARRRAQSPEERRVPGVQEATARRSETRSTGEHRTGPGTLCMFSKGRSDPRGKHRLQGKGGNWVFWHENGDTDDAARPRIQARNDSGLDQPRGSKSDEKSLDKICTQDYRDSAPVPASGHLHTDAW